MSFWEFWPVQPRRQQKQQARQQKKAQYQQALVQKLQEQYRYQKQLAEEAVLKSIVDGGDGYKDRIVIASATRKNRRPKRGNKNRIGFAIKNRMVLVKILMQNMPLS